LRLEVGYGLEVSFRCRCKTADDEVFIPGFREGKFYEGLDAGVDRLIKSSTAKPLPECQSATSGRGDRVRLNLFRCVHRRDAGVRRLLRRLLGRLPAALVVGAGIGFLAWLIVAPLLIACCCCRRLRGDAVRRWGGGMPANGRRWIRGEARWRGFGGGGGFSGGGGGFGVGVASGRW